MTDTEPVAITRDRIRQIPDARRQPVASGNIPSAGSILETLYREHGEISRAEASEDYIGLTDDELAGRIPALVQDCLSEMAQYEGISRRPIEERLKELRGVAPSVTRIIDLSAPGDYYHLVKEDRFKEDPPMRGADRVRADQAAILAVVLSGIKENWPEKDLLLFLNQHVLTTDDPRLNELRETAKQAVSSSEVRLVYAGRNDEIRAIQTVLRQKNVFIPKGNVDFVGPEGIDNTIDQIEKMKQYLEGNLQPGDSFVMPINIQGIRSMRMAERYGMAPPGTNALVYAMATEPGESSLNYRSKEVRAAVFYCLTNQASFTPANHKII